MTFTLTSDELKIVQSGSVDFKKFTDSNKGHNNLDFKDDLSNFLEGMSFTAQDAVDSGFSEAQVKTLTKSLEDKGAIVGDFSLAKSENIEDLLKDCTYFANCKTKSELEINDNWMWQLTDKFINWVAAYNEM